jgi:phosphoribosylformylglycinamidine synthase subunit PurS
MNIAIAIPPTIRTPPIAGEQLTGAWPIIGQQGKESMNLAPQRRRSHRGPHLRTKSGHPMKARVFITLKNGVLDPQGKAIHHALEGLGFGGVNDVRAGKLIELDLADGTTDAEIEDMCRKLLANTVIENFRIERMEPAQA